MITFEVHDPLVASFYLDGFVGGSVALESDAGPSLVPDEALLTLEYQDRPTNVNTDTKFFTR